MSENKWRKRYSFRLTEEDEDIYNLLESSKQTNSEVIRGLLKFALNQMNKEKKNQRVNKHYLTIIEEIDKLKEDQNEGFQMILDKLNSGTIIGNDNDEPNEDSESEKVNQSVNNSLDSLFSSFGITDDE